MPIVKRYPNRKLYNTETKQYITLDGIAALIRQGEDVQIVDHATGEDLTALTLSQIIFEQEKKQSGFLPHPVLTGLVRAGGETLSTLRRTLVSPLGLLRHIDDEIERRINVLISGGELAEDEGRRLLEKLLEQGRRLRDGHQVSDDDIERILNERGVPSRDDFQRVVTQLDTLAAKLDEMNRNVEQV
jgi:polyhydroxyalkanoate synthesis repressor PhaR